MKIETTLDEHAAMLSLEGVLDKLNSKNMTEAGAASELPDDTCVSPRSHSALGAIDISFRAC